MAEEKSSSKGKNITMAIIAYIAFFIPLLTDAKNDPFVKFHVKQGLVLFIGWVVLGVIGSFAWGLGPIISLLDLGLSILMLIGILSAAKGEEKPLPLIGQYAEQFKF